MPVANPAEHTEKVGSKVSIIDPVKVVQLIPTESGWEQKVVAELQDQQCRFLLPVDVDGDGKKELVAAGFKNGLYLLKTGDDEFVVTTIDANSSGYEHATHAADLDKDGKQELYVAADNQGELRRYVYNGESFDRTVIADIASSHITWNLQDGVF